MVLMDAGCEYKYAFSLLSFPHAPNMVPQRLCLRYNPHFSCLWQIHHRPIRPLCRRPLRSKVTHTSLHPVQRIQSERSPSQELSAFETGIEADRILCESWVRPRDDALSPLFVSSDWNRFVFYLTFHLRPLLKSLA
jgi:hypothetical protein